jgi:hypothetical protein
VENVFEETLVRAMMNFSRQLQMMLDTYISYTESLTASSEVLYDTKTINVVTCVKNRYLKILQVL